VIEFERDLGTPQHRQTVRSPHAVFGSPFAPGDLANVSATVQNDQRRITAGEEKKSPASIVKRKALKSFSKASDSH